MELFWRTGYEGTSLHDLLRELGISRSSLYTVYPSKKALFLRSFAHYLESIGMQAFRPLHTGREGEGDDEPRDRIARVFDIVIDQVSGDPLHRGCLMVNTITEMAGRDEEIDRATGAAQEAVRGMFRRALEPLVESGHKDAETAEADADFLLSMFVGLRVRARNGITREAARATVERGLRSVFGRNA